MSAAQSKLFEWFRLKTSIEQMEHELRHDPGSLDRARELMDELQRLSTRSNELLAEIERLRS
jgi:hypothetical protein